jgi:cytochrome P450
MQWIMANLVKYPNVQERVWAEIKGVEEDLHKPYYLKAVVLEGLRAPTWAACSDEDVVLDG